MELDCEQGSSAHLPSFSSQHGDAPASPLVPRTRFMTVPSSWRLIFPVTKSTRAVQ